MIAIYAVYTYNSNMNYSVSLKGL